MFGSSMHRVTPHAASKACIHHPRSYRQEPGQWSCAKTLKPIMVSLRFVGIALPPTPGCRIWAVMVMFFRVLYLASCLSNMALNNSFAFEYISVVLTTTSSGLAAGFLNTSGFEVCRAVERLDSTGRCLPWSKATLKSNGRRVISLTFVGWLYLLMRWIAVLCVVDNTAAPVQFQSVFYANPPDYFGDKASYFCVAVIWSLEIFFVQGALIFTPVFFMSLCILLSEAYTEHNRVIVNLGGHNTDLNGDFTRIRTYHERLCSLVTYVDFIFGKVIFFWFLFLVVTVCLDITQLFTDDTLLKNKTRDDVFFFSLKVIYSVFSFLGTCATAARVSQEAHASLPAVHALTLRSGKMDLDTKLEVQFFLNRLTSPTIGLSGWNFFSINKGFILNVSAALVTYTVVVIQMNPKAMRVIHHLVAQTVNNSTGNQNSNSNNNNNINNHQNISVFNSTASDGL